jgi:lysine decarboxylase
MRSVPKTKKKVLLADSEGCVCARSVIPYPPGSPIICPGEEMTGAIISYLEKLIRDGHKITGIDKDGCIKVGAD